MVYHTDRFKKSIFKWSVASLNEDFTFSKTGCYTKIKESSLSYYLPIAKEKEGGFMPLSRKLAHSEMQTVLSKIC